MKSRAPILGILIVNGPSYEANNQAQQACVSEAVEREKCSLQSGQFTSVYYFTPSFKDLVSLDKTSGTSLGRDSNGLNGNLETQGLDQVGGLRVNFQLAVGVR